MGEASGGLMKAQGAVGEGLSVGLSGTWTGQQDKDGKTTKGQGKRAGKDLQEPVILSWQTIHYSRINRLMIKTGRRLAMDI